MRRASLFICLAIAAAGVQAQHYLSIGAPPGAARVPAARTASAAAVHGTQKAVRPASSLPKDVSLAGKPCVYTPAVIKPIIYDELDFTLPATITACNDLRLTAAQQTACARCIGIKRRDACLATVSDTYWGVDQHSCTWVGDQADPGLSGRQGGGLSSSGRFKEVRYSHGIGLPWQHGMWLGNTTCSVSVKVELTNPAAQQYFPTAMFIFYVNGQDSSGAQVLSPLSSWGACTLKPGRKVCELTIVRPAYLKNVWLNVRRDMYSNGPSNAAVDAWQQTGLSCLDFAPDAGSCSALPARYNYEYSLRILEQPCKPFARPVAQSISYQELPVAENGALMWPGGNEFLVRRSTAYYVRGARTLEWDVRVLPQQAPTAPMFVAVMREGDWAAACTESSDGLFRSCAYGKSSSKALGGSACYARRCKGRIDFRPIFKGPAPSNVYLVVSYLRFTEELKRPWIVNATETPPQTVAVSLVATP